jgi:hypothetical protein
MLCQALHDWDIGPLTTGRRPVWAAAVKELTGSKHLSGGALKKEEFCGNWWRIVHLSVQCTRDALNPLSLTPNS